MPWTNHRQPLHFPLGGRRLIRALRRQRQIWRLAAPVVIPMAFMSGPNGLWITYVSRRLGLREFFLLRPIRCRLKPLLDSARQILLAFNRTAV
jgi:hypothetical protein